jgi:hypothetical protein
MVLLAEVYCLCKPLVRPNQRTVPLQMTTRITLDRVGAATRYGSLGGQCMYMCETVAFPYLRGYIGA